MIDEIKIVPITPQIGAEVLGVDLGKPLSNRERDTIHNAFLKHSVLFFRNQDITIEQQKDFGRVFGELHVHPARDRNGLEGHPEILYLNAGPNTSRVNGDEWHSDVSCDAEPPMGSILRLIEVPSNGGDTLFASMYAAYDGLSKNMKVFLKKLTAVHDGGPIYIDRAKRAGTQLSERIQKLVKKLYLLIKSSHNISWRYQKMRAGRYSIFFSNI